MNDKVVKIEFNIFANSELEAEELIRLIKDFINKQCVEGRKISASKLIDAINKWQNKPFIINAINNYFN